MSAPIITPDEASRPINDAHTEILVTSDLGQFVLMEAGNRPIDLTHVDRLGQQIVQHGYDKGYPILVHPTNGGLLAVVDGQHRLTACRKVNSDIAYRKIPAADAVTYLKLANTTRDWNSKNWLSFHSQPGSPAFIQSYYELQKMADAVGVSAYTMLLICKLIVKKEKRFTDYYQGKVYDILFSGSFDFPLGMKERVVDFLQDLQTIKDLLSEDLKKAENCIKSFVRIMLHDRYNHTRMLLALERRAGDIKKSNSSTRYLEQVLHVYNAHQKKYNQLDLKDFDK